MITCRFSGGLGNNLFQLANIYDIHTKTGIPYFIDRSFTRLTFDGKRLEDDNRFDQSHVFEIPLLFDNSFVYRDEVEYDFSKMKDYFHHDFAGAGNFLHKEPILTDNTVHNGYYQSHKYFSSFNLREAFELNKSTVKSIKQKYSNLFNKPTISLHYRLGGDRKLSKIQKYHKNLSPKFYVDALKSVENKTNKKLKDFNVLLFSDDMPLAMKALDMFGVNYIPISNNNNIEDFIHISLCDHNVIGNSTFGWWASFMNQSEEAIRVVSKTNFVGPKYSNFILDDLFPADWVTL